MIPTHEWNTVLHAQVLNTGGQTLRMLCSVAAEDGVYTLDDLRPIPWGDDRSGRIVTSLLSADGVFDLTDLRTELRGRVRRA